MTCINQPYGSINVIVGPMFAGKSNVLIDGYLEHSADAILVKPERDTRDDVNVIKTHNDRYCSCRTYSTVEAVAGDTKLFKYIFIDEGQFFPDICSGCKLLRSQGHVVTVAALSNNFKCEPFDNIAKLCAIADHVEYKHGTCATLGCTRPSSFTRILQQREGDIHIGGSELYEPCCAIHHAIPGQPAEDFNIFGYNMASMYL